MHDSQKQFLGTQARSNNLPVAQFFIVERVSEVDLNDDSRVPIEFAKDAIYEEDGRLLLNVSLFFETSPSSQLYWNMEKNVSNYVFTKTSIQNYCLTHQDKSLADDTLDNRRLRIVLAQVLGPINEDTFFIARASALRYTQVTLVYQFDDVLGPYNVFLEIPYRSELNEMINYLTPQDLLSRTTFRSYFEASGEMATRMRKNSIDMLQRRRDTRISAKHSLASSSADAGIEMSIKGSPRKLLPPILEVPAGEPKEEEIRQVQDTLTTKQMDKGYARVILSKFKLLVVFSIGCSSTIQSAMDLSHYDAPQGWFITKCVLYGLGAIGSFVTLMSAESLYSFVKFCMKWLNKLLFDPLFAYIVLSRLEKTSALATSPGCVEQ